jgi:anaerobic magnesium-protoporphyrin IX monomethyl ester cyclase
MSKIIDCFLIGHNEMNFTGYKKHICEMGTDSGAYQDLNKNFLQYNNIPYPVSEIFNIFSRHMNDSPGKRNIPPLNIGDTFNLAIAYLGTYLYRRNFTFDYVNTFQDEKALLAKKLANENILTIAIITTLYISVFPILEIVEFIKKHNSTAKIIIGGPFISNQVRSMEPAELEYLFKSIGADFYVNSSQGENALVEIISAIKNNLPLENVNNIYYPLDGKFRENLELKENNRISQNMVKWNLFSDRVKSHLNMRTSISCPFSCKFCGFPEHAGQYQTADIEEIREELDQANKIETVTSVQFIDDTLNVPVKRFKEILKMIIKNNYKIKWHSHFRCQFSDRETVELMKESGCEGVFLGIESGSDNVLKTMNKASKVSQYLKGIELLKKYGILTYGSFIIGFPGETHETVEETVRFIKKSGIDFYRAQLWYCDTLTPIWKEREKYDIKGSHFEWTHATFDSKTAANITDEIFLSVHNPIWVPQYNFEWDGVFHLLHRRFSLEQVKNFLRAFNKGIMEKLITPSQKDVSRDVIEELEASLGKTNTPEETRKEKGTCPGENKGNAFADEAGFDFG